MRNNFLTYAGYGMVSCLCIPLLVKFISASSVWELFIIGLKFGFILYLLPHAIWCS